MFSLSVLAQCSSLKWLEHVKPRTAGCVPGTGTAVAIGHWPSHEVMFSTHRPHIAIATNTTRGKCESSIRIATQVVDIIGVGDLIGCVLAIYRKKKERNDLYNQNDSLLRQRTLRYNNCKFQRHRDGCKRIHHYSIIIL
jgi:hypothetical protein